MVFDNAIANPNLHLMCIQLAQEFFYCVSKRQKTKHYTVNSICWIRPNQRWFKLNSDRASQGNPGRAGGGGLIHDHHGKWIKGFMRNISHATSVAAEFWALSPDACGLTWHHPTDCRTRCSSYCESCSI